MVLLNLNSHQLVWNERSIDFVGMNTLSEWNIALQLRDFLFWNLRIKKEDAYQTVALENRWLAGQDQSGCKIENNALGIDEDHGL